MTRRGKLIFIKFNCNPSFSFIDKRKREELEEKKQELEEILEWNKKRKLIYRGLIYLFIYLFSRRSFGIREGEYDDNTYFGFFQYQHF